MSKSTNDFVELKKWFNVAKYASLEDFNQKDWADQIAKRFFIDQALNNPGHEFLNEFMSRLTVAPLDTFNSDYRNGRHLRQNSAYSTKTVLPMTLSDISVLNDLAKESEAEFSALFDEWNIKRGGINDDGSANENGSAGLGSFAHLRIDLNARDETIQSDFRRWLTTYRRTIALPAVKPHPTNTALKFKDWKEYKLLQYFDIKAWCKWSNKHITQAELLDVLFHGADPSKLKSVQQKLDEIITYQNVMALTSE